MISKKTYSTEMGIITYWTNELIKNRMTLVFLPGLTADHRLFTSQMEYFEDKFNVLVWDAPGHGESRPFVLDFDLDDKAKWLMAILGQEEIINYILVGQSMGGYVAQMFYELFPGKSKGFVSIDSCPLLRKYVTKLEIWGLYNVGPIYKWYPWKMLVRDGSNGCAVTDEGRRLMKEMMESFSKDEYCELAGHGYGMLAHGYDRDWKYKITSPILLICGEKDMAGSAKRYNRAWSKDLGVPVHWIKNAGHNSNTDKPEEVNKLIEEFAKSVC